MVFRFYSLTLQFFGVINDHVDSHLHFRFLEGEVEAGDSAAGHFFGHLLRGERAVERVPVNQLRFLRAFSISFQNVDGLDRISLNSLSINCKQFYTKTRFKDYRKCFGQYCSHTVVKPKP